MPKRKAVKISGLIDSDDEDVMQMNANEGKTVPEEVMEERPLKRARGRPRSSGHGATDTKKPPSKPRATTAQSSVEGAVPKKPAARGRPRAVRFAAESQAQESPDDENEAGNDESLEVQAQQDVSNDELDSPKNVATSKKPEKPAATRGRKKTVTTKQISTDGEFEYTPTGTKSLKPSDQTQNGTKRAAGGRRRAEPEENDVVLESEKWTQEVDESTLPSEELVIPQSQPSSPLKSRGAAKTAQRVLQDSSSRWKPGSISEAEKGAGDPELRRKLGEVTKKYENLEAKFRSLREIGIVEANANVEKLKKQCEATAAASNEMITSLKQELAAQTALGQQTRTLQKKLKERDTEVAGLESQADKLSSQLSSAQNEIKMLQTKLAAARNTVANVESVTSKGPGSAVKNNGANRTLMAANAEAVQAAQIAQLKEDLYSDLTGLIIRDIKKRESDDLYDCIQTGINGTLHFKLAVAHEQESKTTSSLESAEFHYVPLLDENRDRDLVDILPDYLTVDITFSRQQASKFYTRVIDALTKRRVDHD